MNSNLSSTSYPYMVDRLKSTFIDLLIVLSVSFGLSALLELFGEIPNWLRVLLFSLIWLVYEPLFTSLGCTAGNYLMGQRVRHHDDPEKRISFPRAIVRYALKTLLGWLSFITIHSNEERRAIHDLAAGSVMLRK